MANLSIWPKDQFVPHHDGHLFYVANTFSVFNRQTLVSPATAHSNTMASFSASLASLPGSFLFQYIYIYFKY